MTAASGPNSGLVNPIAFDSAASNFACCVSARRSDRKLLTQLFSSPPLSWGRRLLGTVRRGGQARFHSDRRSTRTSVSYERSRLTRYRLHAAPEHIPPGDD